ncbi:MAG: dockerin type I repeat-containing protein [Limnospira sp. PMC 1291.21]|uniref:dockerin type I repeat-containing protein n=1 Tax=Limnospira sp. PMC 1291.21 TaxID=2981074 RepID=UPI0028E16D5D|nr:dockerin type I repeat-containing protein [Limnospira sp. PMC 1291.21]MDT9307866.1 dockerin type I repeat-containing protein [Limnospira sp. PMC 1291.21]
MKLFKKVFFISMVLSVLFRFSTLWGAIVDIRSQNDIVYALQSNPPRLLTYDMTKMEFGPPVELTENPVTFWVDEHGLLIGYHRRVEHRQLDGTSPVHLANTSGNIRNLYATETHYFIDSDLSNNESVVRSFGKHDLLYVALRTFTGTQRLQRLAIVSRIHGVAIGVNDGYSPKHVWMMALYPDGNVGDRVQTVGYDQNPLVPRHVIHPDGNRFVGPDGFVYAIDPGIKVGSLHGEVLDVVFPTTGGTVALRKNGLLFAYDEQDLEIGRYALDHHADRIFLSGSTLHAFRMTASGVSAVQTVQLSAFAMPVPPAPPPSHGFVMATDQVELDPVSGTVFVMDAEARIVLRRDLNTNSWLPPLTLSRRPVRMGVSSSWGRVYFQMGSEEIHEVALDLGQTSDTPWSAAKSQVTGLIPTGESILITTRERASVLSADGATESFEPFPLNSWPAAALYHPGNRRVYLEQANDLYHWDLTETGAWTPTGQTGERTKGGFRPSLVPGATYFTAVSTDGGEILLQNGQILRGENLSLQHMLPVAVADGIWIGGVLFTLRAEGETDTLLQVWASNYLSAQSAVLEGTPLRVFVWNDHLWVVTRRFGQPLFHQLSTDMVLTQSSVINRPPDSISWTGPHVQNGSPVGTQLGTFSTADPNLGSNHSYTYTLGENPGGLLAIEGNVLSLAKQVVYTGWPDFRIFSVISTDPMGQSREESFLLVVQPQNKHLPTNVVSHGPSYELKHMFFDHRGVAYFQQQRGNRTVLHRWCTEERQYLDPIPLAERADFISHDPGNHVLFIAYPNGGVTRVDLEDPTFEEHPLLKLPNSLFSMDIIDGMLVVSLIADFHPRYKVFSLEGQELASRYAGSRSWGGKDQQWDQVRRRVYTYTQSDLDWSRYAHWFELNPDGSFGDAPTGFSLDRLFTPPLRIEPIGARRILLGDGVFHDANTLQPVRSLGQAIVEAFWYGETLYTLATHPQTSGPLSRVQTLLARWVQDGEGGYTKVSEITVEGVPKRIWEVNDTLWVLTHVFDQPRMARFHPETLAINYEAVVNRPPGPPQLSATEINELLPAGTLVGIVSSIDPFPDIEHDYILLSSTGPFTLVGNELRTTRPLDSFSDPSSFMVFLMAWDQFGLGSPGGAQHQIHLRYVPQPPSGVGLSANPVFARDPAGTVAGEFTVEDREGDTVTYTLQLMSNPGGIFAIHGANLSLAQSAPDLQDTVYEIMVRATNSLGKFRDETFQVAILGLPRLSLVTPDPGRNLEDEKVTFSGTVVAPHGFEEIRWSLNGEDKGPLEVADGSYQFDVKLNHPGNNHVQIHVRDDYGNTETVGWHGLWQPIRTLHFGDILETREGAVAFLPLVLEHIGSLRGGLIEIYLPPEHFSGVEWIGAPILDNAFSNWTQDPETGVLRVSFVLGGEPLSGPRSELGFLALRARSVPEDLDATVQIIGVDLTDAEDLRVEYGTHTLPGTVRVLRRTLLGDNNGNGHLDAGDVQQLLAFLSGAVTPEPWDVTGNDLNGNGVLDSGDLSILLARLAEQDRLDVAAFGVHGHESVANLSFDKARYVAQPGESFWVELRLVAPYPPAGIRFRLDYPADVLRLVEGSGLQTGAMVPVTGENAAVVSWSGGAEHNPGEGWVRFAAISPVAWSEMSGVVARFQFTVLPGADEREWAMRVVESETTNEIGVVAAPAPATALYSTLAESVSTYADWSAREFPALPQPVPPLVSTAGDGVSNLLRYALGIGGQDPVPANTLQPMVLSNHAGNSALGLRIQLAGGDLPVQYILETSVDLVEWDTHPLDLRRQFRETSHNGGEALYIFETMLDPGTPLRFMRLKVVLP